MTIAALWQPILAAAVVAFIAGAVIWMAMPWHKTDFSSTGNEEAVRSALKGIAPGQYTVPHCVDNADYKSPEKQAMFKEGPNAFITVIPSGLPAMGGNLALMFIFNLVVAAFCAYVVANTLAPDASYMSVFRVAGTTAFLAYGAAYVQESVWFGRPWSTTVKSTLDALIYGLLTGGVFGWLAV